MAESITRDEVELLLKETQNIKAVKAVKIIHRLGVSAKHIH